MEFSSGEWQKKQTFQDIAHRKLSNVPPSLSNTTLHTDLNLNTLNEEAKFYYIRFHERITTRTNPLIKNLASTTTPGNPPRRLTLL